MRLSRRLHALLEFMSLSVAETLPDRGTVNVGIGHDGAVTVSEVAPWNIPLIARTVSAT